MSYQNRGHHHHSSRKHGDGRKHQDNWYGQNRYTNNSTNSFGPNSAYSDEKSIIKDNQFEERKFSDSHNKNLLNGNNNGQKHFKSGRHDYNDRKPFRNRNDDVFHNQVPKPVDLALINELQYNAVLKQDYTDDEPLATQQFEISDSGDISNSIRLDMRFKKQAIQANSSDWQTFPMLVSLVVENLKSPHQAPLDLVCVIDVSGSMAGSKLKFVKETFEYLLKYLGASDRISIVTFNDQATRIIPLTKASDANKAGIITAVNSVNASGGTDINNAMMHAFHALKSRKSANPVTSIFLLSDGLDKGAQEKIKAALVKFEMEANLSINTFGFGVDHDPELMIDIADLRDGNFYFINQLDTVDECFIDCLGGLLSTIAQTASIKVQAEQSDVLRGVKILQAYGNFSMWEYQDQSNVTKLTNIMSGRQKDFVLKMRISSVRRSINEPVQVKIASAEAIMTGLDGKQIVKKTDLYVTLVGEHEKFEQGENDSEVMKNYYRVKGAFMMDKARRLADEKQWIAAKKSLQSFKNEVESSELSTDQFMKNLVQDLDKAILNVDPDVYRFNGKHNMISNQRAQMQQKSNFDSANNYQNTVQMEMVKAVKTMKKNVE